MLAVVVGIEGGLVGLANGAGGDGSEEAFTAFESGDESSAPLVMSGGGPSRGPCPHIRMVEAGEDTGTAKMPRARSLSRPSLTATSTTESVEAILS